MALRFLDSFDHYQSADITKKWNSVSATNAAVVAGGRNGNCLRLSSASTGYVTKSIDAQVTWIIGFAFKVTQIDPTSTEVLLALKDDATTQIDVRVVASAGTLRITRNGTILATSTNAILADTWYFLELKSTIGNLGSYELRINGEAWIDSAVGDTQASANASANVVLISSVRSGDISPCYYDDLYICDGTGSYNNDFLGDVRIAAVFPDANGSNSDFVGSDSNSVDNFALVDEKTTDFPDDDTTYVQSDTVGAKDTYLFEDVAYAEGETAIDGVQVLVCAKKTAAGDKTICPVVRLADDVDHDGDNVNPSEGSYSYMRQVYERTPDASPQQWTPTNINTTEFGLKVVA